MIFLDETIAREEIKHRKEIFDRAVGGQRPTKEEQFWSKTHNLYNKKYGYPFLKTFILALKPKIWYEIICTEENNKFKGEIFSAVCCPYGKNKYSWEKKDGTKESITSKGLVFELTHGVNFDKVLYRSDFGFLEILYHAKCYDRNMGMSFTKTTWDSDELAMVVEQLSQNKLRFRCKPYHNNDFESLVFTIEWNEVG